jgi:hypothetical protein
VKQKQCLPLPQSRICPVGCVGFKGGPGFKRRKCFLGAGLGFRKYTEGPVDFFFGGPSDGLSTEGVYSAHHIIQ